MLTAADVMTTTVVTVPPDKSVQEIAKLLHECRISGVPVVNASGVVLGIVSEGDLIGHVGTIGEQRRSWWLTLFSGEDELARDYAKTHGRTARDVMSSRVVSISDTTPLAEIARLLERHRIKRVPVVKDGKLIGIVTRSNLLQALAATDVSKPASVDDRKIREHLTAVLNAQPWAHMMTKNVVVENGVVHLFGITHSDEERRALRIAAENVPGVTRVDDQLTRREFSSGE
jgi:CBS domain-containing protein